MRLKQILINLITNSIKFTYEGEIKIIVENHENVYYIIKRKISLKYQWLILGWEYLRR